MKTLKLIILATVLLLAGTSNAQVSFSLNIAAPPMWGPVGSPEVRYYYLPDVESFYDVHSSMFIYFDGGSWIHRSYLPGRYKNYDLYGGYKVVMNDYHGNTPYSHYKEYKSKYARGYRGHGQKTIGERPGNHNYNQPREGNRNEHHNDRGNDKGNSHGNDNNRNGDHGNGGEKHKNK